MRTRHELGLRLEGKSRTAAELQQEKAPESKNQEPGGKQVMGEGRRPNKRGSGWVCGSCGFKGKVTGTARSSVNSNLEKLGDKEVKAQGLRVGRGHLGHKQLAIPSLLITEIPHIVVYGH